MNCPGIRGKILLVGGIRNDFIEEVERWFKVQGWNFLANQLC